MVDDADIRITPAIRRYLAAFDEWLARPSAETMSARRAALERIGGVTELEDARRLRAERRREQSRVASQRYRDRLAA